MLLHLVGADSQDQPAALSRLRAVGYPGEEPGADADISP